MRNLAHELNRLVPVHSIGLFRILFGCLMLINIIEWYDFNLISYYIMEPSVNFRYDFLALPILPEKLLKLMMHGMIISTLLMITGVLFRWAVLYFFLSFSYFFLVDQTFYNNHYYLIILLSGMMFFMDLDKSFTLRKIKGNTLIGMWQYWLLRFQVIIVYFYGGIAKINPYWFNHEPTREILNSKAIRSGIDALTSEFMIGLITYGGLVFDLFIGFALLYKPTRKIAFIAAIGFNITNAWLFNDISIFPYFMLGALILFFEPDEVSTWLVKMKLIKQFSSTKESAIKLPKWGLFMLSSYVLFQLGFPLRQYFIDGYADWTGEGQRFSWHMKIQNRIYDIRNIKMYIDTGSERSQIDIRKYLNDDQYHQMLHSPQMVIQFAEFIEDHARVNYGILSPKITAEIPIGFNGEKPTLMFYPDKDLLEEYRTHQSFNDWMPPAPGIN